MNRLSYIASDYAGIDAGDLHFYYGYEVTSPSGEWCFEVKRGREILLTIPVSKLKVRNSFDCGEVLLEAIALLIEAGNLKLEIDP